jgi:GNAT superfamily N-acetyltransferase
MSTLVRRAAVGFILRDCTEEGGKRLLASLSAAQFDSRLARDYRYHLALSGHSLVGVVGLRGRSHLYHLFVDEDYAGQGLGRQLWNLCRSDARATYGTNRFTVNASVFATDFYLALGFTRTGPLETGQGIGAVPMVFGPGLEEH